VQRAGRAFQKVRTEIARALSQERVPRGTNAETTIDVASVVEGERGEEKGSTRREYAEVLKRLSAAREARPECVRHSRSIRAWAHRDYRHRSTIIDTHRVIEVWWLKVCNIFICNIFANVELRDIRLRDIFEQGWFSRGNCCEIGERRVKLWEINIENIRPANISSLETAESLLVIEIIIDKR